MQYNKVEISGINTSQLELLSEEETTSLIAAAKQGDRTARDRLIRGNLRLVLSVMQRFIGKGESSDDLFQVGVIGLIKAIDNFKPDFGVKLSTYAVPMILGEIKRYLRDYRHVRVSRSMRDLAYKAMQVRERLTAANMSEPTVDMIADELGVKRSEVVIALESVSDPVSLYEPVYSESGDTLYLLDQMTDNTDASAALNEMLVRDAVKKLPERERRILDLRYMRGRTQVEVAGEIGISQAQVSRLEKSAILNIRRQIEA
ncbi:MAG: SigB/SigF/SigG family RNA polymerase sigma factor [Ruminococcus sp.]|nr:SigB/SigF/SigG family RNA polymerase sigma factor [Ruminococcus sp.]